MMKASPGIVLLAFFLLCPASSGRSIPVPGLDLLPASFPDLVDSVLKTQEQYGSFFLSRLLDSYEAQARDYEMQKVFRGLIDQIDDADLASFLIGRGVRPDRPEAITSDNMIAYFQHKHLGTETAYAWIDLSKGSPEFVKAVMEWQAIRRERGYEFIPTCCLLARAKIESKKDGEVWADLFKATFATLKESDADRKGLMMHGLLLHLLKGELKGIEPSAADRFAFLAAELKEQKDLSQPYPQMVVWALYEASQVSSRYDQAVRWAKEITPRACGLFWTFLAQWSVQDLQAAKATLIEIEALSSGDEKMRSGCRDMIQTLEKLEKKRGPDKKAASREKEQPLLEAQVNGHPVHLAIDTGTEILVVFSYAADRIGLPYQRPMGPLDPSRVKPGQFVVYPSDVCRLRLGTYEAPTRLAIGDLPPGLRAPGVDGVLGWRAISNNVWHLDWGQKVLEPVPQVPGSVAQWRRFDLYSPSGMTVLALRVSGSSAPPQAVYLDTGDSGGVLVTSALWKEILSQHPGLPTAIEGVYDPGAGYHTLTICWLPVLKLGDIELHDVPVGEAAQVHQQWPAYLARIGLYALTRLELVVDGKQNHIYVRTKEDYSRKYDYNRAGVVFLPVDEQSGDLLAKVLDGGPAYEAGLRNGDRLLRVNGRDITGWRTDPNGWMSDPSTFQQAPGTKVALSVVRDTHPMEVTVVLKELLPIDAVPPSRQENQASRSPQETR